MRWLAKIHPRNRELRTAEGDHALVPLGISASKAGDLARV